MLKKVLTILITTFILALSLPSITQSSFAKAGDSCSESSDCDAGQACIPDDKGNGKCQTRLSEATFPVKTLSLGGSDQEQTYLKNDNPIVFFILKIIEFATTIIGSIALILLIVAGFMFMASQGNQQSIDNAKDVVKYAVIGLIVTFTSYIITIFVQSLFTAS